MRRIEAVSFVRADRVPAMADAEAVMAGVSRRPGVRLSGLVLNRRGLERALAAGVDEINVVVLVTEPSPGGTRAMGVDEAVAMWRAVAAAPPRPACPRRSPCRPPSVAPTRGWSTPPRSASWPAGWPRPGPSRSPWPTPSARRPARGGSLVRSVAEATGLPVRVHLHNSRNTGYANAVAAVAAGAAALDASIGGIGGCPFAPGATGNIATEDLVHLLDRMGIATGLRPRRAPRRLAAGWPGPSVTHCPARWPMLDHSPDRPPPRNPMPFGV